MSRGFVNSKFNVDNVCSVDVNGLTDLSFARIWSSPSHFGERATFQTQDRLTSLLIVNNIRGNESGLYRWVRILEGC